MSERQRGAADGRRDKGIGRREFLGRSAALGAGLSVGAASILGAAGANERFVVGVMGLGRGLGLITTMFKVPGVEVGAVCDVDRTRIDRAMRTVTGVQERKPAGVQDFRRMLDDGALDAIFIATCNHWHAPATILACKAGKHVYVEKPGSHNPREGELMVAAARRHDRVVQMGNQRRSWPSVIEAIEKVRGGAIGTVRSARCWYSSRRGSIGKGKPAEVPAHLDYSLWQGPAPERAYKSNLVHYNWHWHWGNGELGNNGIHALDVARWGLGVDCPRTVSYVGGRYHHDDDQETPDTGVASFDFGHVGATWEGSSCHPRQPDHTPFVAFYGDGGSLAITDPGYILWDLAGKEVERGQARRDDPAHVANFLDCIRSGKRPNSDIEEGQKSTLLCHLGNIAYRTGETIDLDPATGRMKASKRAEELWGREYREGWEPSVG